MPCLCQVISLQRVEVEAVAVWADGAMAWMEWDMHSSTGAMHEKLVSSGGWVKTVGTLITGRW